jgi:hypothetical protein
MKNTTIKTSEDAEVFLDRVVSRPGYHVRLCGREGSGKTMIARRIAARIPAPGPCEQIQAAWINQAAGFHDRPSDVPAFRAPHLTCSFAAMFGGGRSSWRPGEVTLSNGGLLYLDDAPEFSSSQLRELARLMSRPDATIQAQYCMVPARPHTIVLGEVLGEGERDHRTRILDPFIAETITLAWSPKEAQHFSKLHMPWPAWVPAAL